MEVNAADRVRFHHVAGPAVAVIAFPVVILKLIVDRRFGLVQLIADGRPTVGPLREVIDLEGDRSRGRVDDLEPFLCVIPGGMNDEEMVG